MTTNIKEKQIAKFFNHLGDRGITEQEEILVTSFYDFLNKEDELAELLKLPLNKLIEKLGTGTGNSMFRLEGSFTHDFGWGAIWTTTINWEETPEKAVAKLLLELNKPKG